jgi:hypothetical protein
MQLFTADRPDTSHAEHGDQTIWAFNESAEKVYGGLDQLFRNLGPPPDTIVEHNQTQRSDEGEQL